MNTPRPLHISSATDSELVDLVRHSHIFEDDFRDHLHAEFARRFPYIEATPVTADRLAYINRS